MFAVIETGGKQYVVRKGDVLNIEKIQAPKKGSALTFDKVLLSNNGKATKIGTPYVAGAKVGAKFVEEGRGKKITVIKFKPKIRYRIKKGHRQPHTKVEITSIS